MQAFEIRESAERQWEPGMDWQMRQFQVRAIRGYIVRRTDDGHGGQVGEPSAKDYWKSGNGTGRRVQVIPDHVELPHK